MPQCQFHVSAVFGFRKVIKEIFSELHETKANIPIFPGSIQNTEEETEGGHEAASPGGGAAGSLAAPPRGVGPSGLHRLRPFAYLNPPTIQDLGPEHFSTIRSRAAAAVNPSSGGFRSSSRHPAGEGNHHRRALHHHARLRTDV